MSTDNRIVKESLLQTMSYFHKFCTTHNLEYFLIGGSLLGAIRHQGFIPWDDDIDVVMPRADYNKLRELAYEFDYPFAYRDYRVDQDYIYPYTKVVNNEVVIEETCFRPFKSGVWIDIFPLDYTFNHITLRKIHFLSLSMLRKALILKYGAFKLEKYNWLTSTAIQAIYPIVNKTPRKQLNILFDLLESSPNKIFSQNKYLANLHGAWGIKEVAPKEIFNEKILYNFEGYQFWGIKDYDFWLKKVYGDYMQLPPMNQRIPVHIGRILKD